MLGRRNWIGSSPRMRGKLAAGARRRGRRRIIPAHAGQTPAEPWKKPARSDHPRACGANFSAIGFPALTSGSSPRMRGKLGHGQVVSAGKRIIPAHAGQTCSKATNSCARTDHPRACGANLKIGASGSEQDGSSPRMRGKLRGLFVDVAQVRIIPAHAGQTRTRSGDGTLSQDHPRACGANSADVILCASIAGSSPRMRGKPALLRSSICPRRIIPAHAGQTPSVHILAELGADHPRACGAN